MWPRKFDSIRFEKKRLSFLDCLLSAKTWEKISITGFWKYPIILMPSRRHCNASNGFLKERYIKQSHETLKLYDIVIFMNISTIYFCYQVHSLNKIWKKLSKLMEDNKNILDAVKQQFYFYLFFFYFYVHCVLQYSII